MHIKWFRLSLITVLLSACVNAPVKDRSPSSETDRDMDPAWKLIQVVKLDSQNRALFMVEDTKEGRFSIAECVTPDNSAAGLVITNSICTRLTKSWVPDEDQYRKSFDNSFAEEVNFHNQILRKKWSVYASLKNLSLASLVALLSHRALTIYTLRQRFAPSTEKGLRVDGLTTRDLIGSTMVFIIGAVTAAVGIGTMVVLEGVDGTDRKSRSIEKDLFKFDQTLTKDQLTQLSGETYSAIRASLLVAMDAKITM